MARSGRNDKHQKEVAGETGVQGAQPARRELPTVAWCVRGGGVGVQHLAETGLLALFAHGVIRG
ncbi:MAG: hypothetical protein MUF54_11845, partial [Polyangiaceae bacterium]|nr:hypothetical protein [Polyangiaceae bacterium]